MWVLQHPGAALMLEFIVEHYHQIQQLTVAMMMGPDATEADQAGLAQIMAEALDGVVARGQGMVEEFSNLEMPGTIIEETLIVDWAIDMVKNTLGGKYKKGIEAVRYALDKLGLWSKITGAIAGAFTAVLPEANPNNVWKNWVRPPIETKFGTVRDDLVGGLLKQLNQVPFLGRKVAEPTKHPIKFEFDDSEEFDEAETYPAEDGHAVGLDGAMPSVAGGERLPPGLRARAERGLGHDFGHVRLHRDADAERVTSRLGAEGVTTGSHVYLRPGLSPDGEFGREVLHHELAHVIQQTGPRPLDGEHSAQPATGAPARGVAFDPAREAAADRAASRAASGTYATAPADVGGRSAGLQPFVPDEFLQKFLTGLTRGKGLALGKKMGDRKQALGAASLHTDPNAIAIKKALELSLFAQLTASTAIYRAPFDTARTEISALLAKHKARIEKVLPDILEVAALVVTGKKEGDKPAPELWYIAPRRLALAIERYLYSTTGMGINVELQEKTARELVGARKRPVLDTANPIKSITLSYVHLPAIDPTEAKPLWDLVVKNTKFTSYSAATHDLHVAVAKLILSRYNPRPDLYHAPKGKLELTEGYVRSVNSLVGRLQSKILKKNYTWPSPADYADPDGTGSVGVRYGTYGTWSGKGEEEREAHHITQFLLVEYFANKNTKKPFPHAGAAAKLYPGLLPVKSERIDSISDAKGNQIEIDHWYKNHGGEMPTIYLSRFTHQSPIHFRREEPDEHTAASRRASQGWTAHNVFRDAMLRHRLVVETEAKLLLGDDKKALEALKALKSAGGDDLAPDGMKITRNRFRTAIYEAARHVYSEMIKDMYPKLETALYEYEVRYYNAVAEQKQSTARITPADMKPALTAAQARNKTDFGKPSGFEP